MKPILFFLACTLLFASCTKDNGGVPAKPIPLIKTIKSTSSGTTYKYQYDAEGRILAITNDHDLSKETFTYSTGQCKEDTYNNAGVYWYSTVHKLDANTLAVQSDYPGSTDTTFRLFNTARLVLKEITSFNGRRYSQSNYYTGEQLDSSIRTHTNGAVSAKIYYEYYPNISNTVGPVNQGMAFFGKVSPKALKKTTEFYYDQDGTYLGTGTIDATYETDASGRISKAVSTGSSSSSLLYTYIN